MVNVWSLGAEPQPTTRAGAARCLRYPVGQWPGHLWPGFPSRGQPWAAAIEDKSPHLSGSFLPAPRRARWPDPGPLWPGFGARSREFPLPLTDAARPPDTPRRCLVKTARGLRPAYTLRHYEG